MLVRSLGTSTTLVMRYSGVGYFNVTGAASRVRTDIVALGLNVPVAPGTALVTTIVRTTRCERTTNFVPTLTRVRTSTLTFLVTAGAVVVFMVMV